MQHQLLVIDDSKQIHPLVKAMLADEPVEIHSALNPELGLTLAASLKPDLILLDVQMPEIDGFEVCRRLKADPVTAGVPVVFLTAMDSTEETVRGLELGAVDYVTKPFEVSELVARVRSSLRIGDSIRLLEKRATIDPLTGLGNRAMFEQRLNAEVSLRARSGNPLSCIVLDVDQFKGINDSYGHPFGDQALREIARAVAKLCRTEDVACRLGGEEFVVLAPNTNAANAMLLAERMRIAVAKIRLAKDGAPISVTCSLGVAEARDLTDRTMLNRADEALYQSKQNGRNRVTLASSQFSAHAIVA